MKKNTSLNLDKFRAVIQKMCDLQASPSRMIPRVVSRQTEIDRHFGAERLAATLFSFLRNPANRPPIVNGPKGPETHEPMPDISDLITKLKKGNLGKPSLG